MAWDGTIKKVLCNECSKTSIEKQSIEEEFCWWCKSTDIGLITD